MKKPQNSIFIDDVSSGVLLNVAKDKMPSNAVPFAVNVCFDEEIGAAKVRKGSTIIGSQIVDGNPILGLANLRRRADTNHALLAVISDGTNSDIYKGETWTKSLEDDTKDLKTRFVQFLGSIARVNGTDDAKSFDGSSWLTSGGVFDLSNFPTSDFVIVYKDRVIGMTKDGTLNISSVPKFHLDYDAQSANFTVGAILTGDTSGATGIIDKDTDSGATGTLILTEKIGDFQDNETITDDNSTPGSATANGAGSWRIEWTRGYKVIPIDPDNGFKGEATGLGIIGGLLFILFERAFYTWNGSATQADPIGSIGCSSQESVASGAKELFFANKNGVYITQGGFPQLISIFLQPLFDNMSSVNYQHIAGGCDDKHYYCSIGDTSFQGITISNCVLRFTIKTQEWAIYSFPTMPRVFARYINDNDVKLLFGDDDGQVFEIDSSAYSDNGAPIDFELHLRDLFLPSEGQKKNIEDELNLITENSEGAILYKRVDTNKNRHEDWKKIAEIRENNQKIPIGSIEYKKLRFKIAGVSSKGRFVFYKLEALKTNLLI